MEVHAFVAEQYPAVSAVVWCAPKAANALPEGRGIDALLNAMGALHGRLRDAERDGGTPHDGGALDSERRPSSAAAAAARSAAEARRPSPRLSGGSTRRRVTVVLNAQLENRPMQDAVRRGSRGRPSCCTLTALGATYYAMIDARTHPAQPLHADEVVKALLLLSRALLDKETPYLLPTCTARRR